MDDTQLLKDLAAAWKLNGSSYSQAVGKAYSAAALRSAPSTTPTPTPVPTPTPTPTPTPVPSGLRRPTSWSDFPGVNFTEMTGTVHPTNTQQVLKYLSMNEPNNGDAIVDPSQNGYNGYVLDTCRMRGREGPRGAGAAITIKGSYIEVVAQSGDHADGEQEYGGGGLTVVSSTILCGGPGATCIFAADNSHGTILLDSSYFGVVPGASTPGFLVRINSDGADAVRVRNCVFEKGGASNAIASNLVVEWTNNTYTDGTAVPRP